MPLGVEDYAANAAAMWSSLAPEEARPLDAPPGVSATRLLRRQGNRVILTKPQAPPPPGTRPAFLDRLPSGYTVVEDAFDGLRLQADGDMRVLHLPVMARASAPAAAAVPRGVTVRPVADTAALRVAEDVIISGFNYPDLQQGPPGRLLPDVVVQRPGWQVWLCEDEGAPAAAGLTFDDGTALGVYFMATLAEHRSRGLARAVLTTALAAGPDRPAALVATEAGRPLYTSLGFAEVATSVWYLWHQG